jgi:hypothetical protein
MMHTLTRLFCAAALLALAVVIPVRAAETKPEIIESLTVGPVTYTNVQMLSRTKSDVFIRHVGGVINIKIKDLDKSTQLQLGYHLADVASTNAVAVTRSAMPDIRIDPRFEELTEQVIWESQEFLSKVSPRVLQAAAGVAFVLYLLFCWCCRQICRKAGQTSVGLVWLPLLKQIPLFRAAGMSPWWIVTNLLPPVFVIGFIVWCFKIARARGKGPLTGILLLLPVFNVFAFLYLAFADRLASDDQDSGKLFSMPQQSRRTAA